jgi:hypothetical protein
LGHTCQKSLVHATELFQFSYKQITRVPQTVHKMPLIRTLWRLFWNTTTLVGDH